MGISWNKVKKIMISVIIAFVITIVLLLLLALLLYLMQWNLEKVTMGIIGIYIFSCAIGGWSAGKKMKKRKYLWGLVTGALYFLILMVISALSEYGVQSKGMEILSVAVMCLGAGTLGGMLS